MTAHSSRPAELMLNLAAPTAPRWFERVENDLDTILVDHTHLEKRAASTALGMIFKYSDRPRLCGTLSKVVREEMGHFEAMLDVLDDRGLQLRKLRPAPYASQLVNHIRGGEPETLIDKLLVAALIEARSCERFQILAERLADPGLAGYYGQLFESEARHYTVYTDLARRFVDPQIVKARLQKLAEYELDALRASSDTARLHSW